MGGAIKKAKKRNGGEGGRAEQPSRQLGLLGPACHRKRLEDSTSVSGAGFCSLCACGSTA